MIHCRSSTSILYLVPAFLFIAWPMVLKGDSTLYVDYQAKPPELIEGIDGGASGVLVDILNRAASRIGYAVKWRPTKFARSMDDLVNGAVDIVPRVINIPERSSICYFLGSIYSYNLDLAFLTRKGIQDTFKDVDSLKTFKCGVIDPAYLPSALQGLSEDQKVPCVDEEQLISLLMAGRFDVGIVRDRKTIAAAIEGIGLSAPPNESSLFAYAWYTIPTKMEIYFAFSKSSPNQGARAKLRRELDAMVRSGEIKKICDSYQFEIRAD